MTANSEDLNLYFESLADEQVAYLELLETKHARYRDNYSTLNQFNQIHKQNFIENNIGYLDGDADAEYRTALETYNNAKYNSFALLGGVTSVYCLYKLATTPKTSKISRFALRGGLYGIFSAGLYMGYEHARLKGSLESLFIHIMQRKIKERTASKLIN